MLMERLIVQLDKIDYKKGSMVGKVGQDLISSILDKLQVHRSPFSTRFEGNQAIQLCGGDGELLCRKQMGCPSAPTWCVTIDCRILERVQPSIFLF